MNLRALVLNLKLLINNKAGFQEIEKLFLYFHSNNRINDRFSILSLSRIYDLAFRYLLPLNIEKTIEFAAKACYNIPDSPLLRYYYASILLKAERNIESAGEFSKSLTLLTEQKKFFNPDYYMNLFRDGEFHQAIALYKSAYYQDAEKILNKIKLTYGNYLYTDNILKKISVMGDLKSNKTFIPERIIKKPEITENGLSLCMIVKNEAETIVSCLESVRDLVDEIIIMDTGSEDQTREQISKLDNMPPIRVIALTWEDDFSRARNTGFVNANHNWIMVLDADEILEIHDKNLIRKAISEDENLAYSLSFYNYRKGEENLKRIYIDTIRIFRNIPEIYYQGEIHELLDSSINKFSGQFQTIIKKLPAFIRHSGYSLSDESKNIKKLYRNMSILENIKDKEDISPERKIYNLNKLIYHYRTLRDVKKIEEAIEKVREIVFYQGKKIPDTDFSLLYFYLNLLEYYQDLNMIQKLFATAIEALDFFPDSPYIYYYLIEAYSSSDNHENCLKACELNLKIIQSNKYIKIDYLFTGEDLLHHAEEKRNNLLNNNIYSRTIYKTEKGKVSGVIIAKNEEKIIQNAINSLIEICNEVIVLDTGSEDQTVQKAREAGAKVYFYHWDNDFSIAKNKAMEFSSSEWIFFLDADERLINANKENILRLIKRPEIAGYNVTRTELTDQRKISLIRLFRNSEEIFFEGPIHEQLERSLLNYCQKYNLYIDDSELEIEHLKYNQQSYSEKKLRNIDILRNAIKNKSLEKRLKVFYKIKLASEYLDYLPQNSVNLHAEVYSELKKGIINDLSNFPPLVQFAEEYANLFMTEQKYEIAEEILDFGLKYIPDSISLNFLLAETYFRQNQLQKSLLLFQKCLDLYKSNKYYKNSIVDLRVIRVLIPERINIILNS